MARPKSRISEQVEFSTEQQEGAGKPQRRRKRVPRAQNSVQEGVAESESKTKTRAKSKAKASKTKTTAKSTPKVGVKKSHELLEDGDGVESKLESELDFSVPDLELFDFNLDSEQDLGFEEMEHKNVAKSAYETKGIIDHESYAEDEFKAKFQQLELHLPKAQLDEDEEVSKEENESVPVSSSFSEMEIEETAEEIPSSQCQENIVTPPSYYKERVFFRGEDYFAALLEDIEQAKRSIDLETYIFELDNLGKRVLRKLNEAAQRGVRVRVMVDGAGAPQWGGNLVRMLEHVGGKTRVFHPFPWHLWQWSRAKVRVHSVLKAIYLLLKMNSRNHRKTCVIDKKIAYVGGFNIADSHVDDTTEIEEKLGRKPEHANTRHGWRDSGVRLEGANLSTLTTAFDAAWDHLTTNERLRQIFRHVYTNPIFRLNYSWHRRRVLYKNLLHRLGQCEQRVWITNAYFVPDNFLLRKLQDAALRGVDVRILLPRESDIAFMPWASEAFYERLLKAGVRIFEYLPTVLHSKTLILDDWMLIGSSNLNHRSLLHDLEVDVNLRLPASMQALVEQFQEDLQYSREVTLETRRKLTLYQRIVAWISLYLKYWI